MPRRLLMKAHPERFGPLGGARWRGGIYGDQLPADHPVEGSIFHGAFGLGAFQVIYATSSFPLVGISPACSGSRCWLAGAHLPGAVERAGVLLFAMWSAWRVSSPRRRR
jgi:hypothetical protein